MRLIGAACVPLVLAACGIARPPAAADAPVPARWDAPLPPASGPGAPALPHAGSLSAMADWWRLPGDPLLAELIEAAQAASPTVANAAANIAEARALRVQAGAALAPTLDGSLSASRSNAPTGSFGGVGDADVGAGTAMAIPAITTLQAGLHSSWEIDLFGGLRASRDAAQARLNASQAGWHDARVSVAAETANAYFAERACVRQLAVAESDTRSRQETARLTDLSAQAGFTPPADAALARAGASDASARLTQQRAQCAILRKGLVALTGIEAAELARRLEALPSDTTLPPLHAVDSLPARVLAQRPDVYAAELGVASASADAGAAQAQRYPRLSLQGSIGRLQIRTSGLRESLDTWSIGPVALTVPLFDGGRRAASAEAAQARYDEAVTRYRAAVRVAVREVEEALVNLDSTDARAGDADSAVRNYQISFDATQARYDSGMVSLFELEDARRTLFAAQTSRVSLQRERAEAWVALYRATGGGWARPDGTASTTPSTLAASP